MKKHIYSEALEEEIINTKYIPRKFKENEKLKLYHKYWIPEFGGTIKVHEIEYINGIPYYFIKSNRLFPLFSQIFLKSSVFKAFWQTSGLYIV